MKNNNLISINGKISSGKDTIGNIIQIFTALPHLTDTGVKSFLGREIDSPYKIKKFADKLKDMVCLLIGCSREQLENREFKEKELGEEWWYYTVRLNKSETLVPYLETKGELKEETLVKLTPRLLLQLLGSECGREIIHPNIWVNSLFADYKPIYIGGIDPYKHTTAEDVSIAKIYPKIIITDMRFPNEMKAVKDRNGITIKVERPVYCLNCPMKDLESQDCGDCAVYQDEIYPRLHESEIALDSETRWDYVIDNNSTIEDLIKKVREILNKENII